MRPETAIGLGVAAVAVGAGAVVLTNVLVDDEMALKAKAPKAPKPIAGPPSPVLPIPAAPVAPDQAAADAERSAKILSRRRNDGDVVYEDGTLFPATPNTPVYGTYPRYPVYPDSYYPDPYYPDVFIDPYGGPVYIDPFDPFGLDPHRGRYDEYPHNHGYYEDY